MSRDGWSPGWEVRAGAVVVRSLRCAGCSAYRQAGAQSKIPRSIAPAKSSCDDRAQRAAKQEQLKEEGGTATLERWPQRAG